MAENNKLSASSDYPPSDGSNELNASASLSNNDNSISGGVRESLELGTSSTTATINAAASAAPEMKNVQDLTRYVEMLLGQMQERFQAISDQVLSRIDDMGNRIDDLERNIADLVTQSGVDGGPPK